MLGPLQTRVCGPRHTLRAPSGGFIEGVQFTIQTCKTLRALLTLNLLSVCQASEQGICGRFQLLFPYFADLSEDFVTSAGSHTGVGASNCWTSDAIRFTHSSFAASSSGLKPPDKALVRQEAANDEVCEPTRFSVLVGAPLFRDPELMMHRKFFERLRPGLATATLKFKSLIPAKLRAMGCTFATHRWITTSLVPEKS